MSSYSYETLPGQTIVRKREDGLAARDLIEELDRNGEGIVVLDDSGESDDFLQALEGSPCGDLHQADWSPYYRNLPYNGFAPW